MRKYLWASIFGGIVILAIVFLAFSVPRAKEAQCFEGYVSVKRTDFPNAQWFIVGDAEFCGEFRPTHGPSKLLPGGRSGSAR